MAKKSSINFKKFGLNRLKNRLKTVKTVVEINGRKYDARTGALVAKELVNNTTQKTMAGLKKGVFIDGVNRRRAPKQVIQNKPKAQPVTKIQPTDVSQLARPQKAKTLLRSVVKKPVGALSNKTYNANLEVTNLKNNLFSKVSNERANRAADVNQSGQIKKFGSANNKVQTKVTANLPIVKEPEQKIALPVPPPLFGKFFKKVPLPPKKEVFEHHVVDATKNKPLPKDRILIRLSRHLNLKPKVLAIVSACLILVVLGSYVAYIKIPSIAMKVASNQAGFGGHLPSSIPAGFSFKGPIKSSKSIITLNYSSNSDQRYFTIVQKPTSWSSEALLANYLVSSRLQYQTYHDKGLTVYIYNEGNATWVDKGVWYSLNGHDSLSADQILAIAGSL